MKIDLCKLTADLLPLYADDLLSPETRQAVEAHAAECPACARLLLEAGGMAVTPPPVAELDERHAAARRFMLRLRRLAFYGLALFLALLIAVGTLSYQVASRPGDARPLKVSNASDWASKAIPGWERAAAEGLLVDLNMTERIRETDATVTLEEAWFGESQTYILYTVRAPKGEHLYVTQARLKDLGFIGSPRTMGGFSSQGYHNVVHFYHAPVAAGQVLELELGAWGLITPKTPRSDLNFSRSAGRAVRFTLTVPPTVQSDKVESYRVDRQHTWLGRTVAIERLDVGLRETRLHGWIQLPPGEQAPVLGGNLAFGSAERGFTGYKMEPSGQPGLYRFEAVAEPPDSWPVPVKLRLEALQFAREEPIELEIPWAKYQGRGDIEVEPDDRQRLVFYDSEVELDRFYYDGLGVNFIIHQPTGRTPHVSFVAGWYDEIRFLSPDGRVFGLGGGGSGHDGKHHFWGINLEEDAAPLLRDVESLVLVIGSPEGRMLIGETWDLKLEPIR